MQAQSQALDDAISLLLDSLTRSLHRQLDAEDQASNEGSDEGGGATVALLVMSAEQILSNFESVTLQRVSSIIERYRKQGAEPSLGTSVAERVASFRQLRKELNNAWDRTRDNLAFHEVAGQQLKDDTAHVEALKNNLCSLIYSLESALCVPELIEVDVHRPPLRGYEDMTDRAHQTELARLSKLARAKAKALDSARKQTPSEQAAITPAFTKLREIRSFRKTNQRLCAFEVEKERAKYELELVDYAVPWFFIDQNCQMSRLNHAGMGKRHGMPPPPKVPQNEPKPPKALFVLDEILRPLNHDSEQLREEADAVGYNIELHAVHGARHRQHLLRFSGNDREKVLKSGFPQNSVISSMDAEIWHAKDRHTVLDRTQIPLPVAALCLEKQPLYDDRASKPSR